MARQSATIGDSSNCIEANTDSRSLATDRRSLFALLPWCHGISPPLISQTVGVTTYRRRRLSLYVSLRLLLSHSLSRSPGLTPVNLVRVLFQRKINKDNNDMIFIQQPLNNLQYSTDITKKTTYTVLNTNFICENPDKQANILSLSVLY
ncbi:hypothetical protein L1887_39321 [Cichorium endivia]|nr:hypothetical protein L1887_39321 [Cichorium endivia]